MTPPWSEALTRALLDFNGKSTDSLRRFASACPLDAALIAALCDFAEADDRNTAAAATWLLKRYGVKGAALTPGQAETLLRLLLKETSWLCHLHVLQMIDSLVVPAGLAERLMAALAEHASGDNAFIRAWSVHAAAALADQHAQYRGRALHLLLEAGQDAAPSVQARLRKTSRAFDWI